MTEADLHKEYFQWMCQFISKNEEYRKLLTKLHDTEFYCVIVRDENRAADGVDLRYRFGYERGYDHSTISGYLDVRPCSVFEMMLALAIRCEEHIMGDSDFGDRTSVWFWDMVENLGLIDMTDDFYDDEEVDCVLYDFMERNFKRDGSGSLFTTKDPSIDMRDIEIWYQMFRFLNYI